jgi:predicted regulator of Ras-like GTPase activity (Roadblock/LC7/MglB family)
MSELHAGSRSDRLDRAIHGLLAQTPEIEAAAVVSFDGLPMASALPPSMDEDRVAAMSAALLSLGERAAQGLGRGELSQVYIEGDAGTVFLVSADDEAVLVAVAAKGAKVGMMLFEVRRAAAAVAEVLRAEDVADVPAPEVSAQAEAPNEPLLSAVPSLPAEPITYVSEPASYASQAEAPAWTSYAPSGSVLPGDNPTWS